MPNQQKAAACNRQLSHVLGFDLTSTHDSSPNADGAHAAGEADRDADDPVVPAGKHVRQHARGGCQGVHRGVEAIRAGTLRTARPSTEEGRVRDAGVVVG